MQEQRTEVSTLRDQRKYYRGWAERLAATLDALVERPNDRAIAAEGDELVKQWYRERLEGREEKEKKNPLPSSSSHA